MLSIILRPLLKNTNRKVGNIELPVDTEISLSMIESGCLFFTLDDKAALLIKDTREKIKLLRNINGITFNFELIERPEFPSMAMHMEINTVSNTSYKFDYFFNTESIEDISLLHKLKDQNCFDILFYDEQIEHLKTTELSKDDISELNSLINRATE